MVSVENKMPVKSTAICCVFLSVILFVVLMSYLGISGATRGRDKLYKQYRNITNNGRAGVSMLSRSVRVRDGAYRRSGEQNVISFFIKLGRFV